VYLLDRLQDVEGRTIRWRAEHDKLRKTWSCSRRTQRWTNSFASGAALVGAGL